MGCKVKTILAPNGQPSKVFQEISSVYGAEVGLVAYLHMHSEEFANKYEGKPTDENGEYNFRLVLDSMNEGNSAVNKVVERSIGVRKGSNKLVEYETENAKEKAKQFNEAFKRDRNPFIAEVQTNESGKSVIVVRELNDTRFDPDEGKDLETEQEDEDDPLGYLEFTEDEDFEAADAWFTDYMDIDENQYDSLDDIEFDDLDMSDDLFSDIDIDADLAHLMDDIVDDLVTTKKARPTKKDHKYKSLLKSIALQKKNAELRLARVETNIKNALKEHDNDKVLRLKKKASAHRITISDLNDKAAKALEFNKLSQVTGIVDIELKQAEKQMAHLPTMDITQLQGIKRMLNFWSKAGEFKDDQNHILFTPQDLDSDPMKKLFRRYKDKADDMIAKIDDQLKIHADRFLKEKLSKDANLNDAMKMATDINWLASRGLDISRMDNMILQAIYKGVTQAQQRAKMETDKVVAKIDEMMPRVLVEAKKVNKSDNPFDIFIQKDAEGRRTGNAVAAVSVEYERTKDRKFRSVVRNKKATYKDKEKAYKWLRENEMFFDWRKIFFDHKRNVLHSGKSFTKEQKDKHIAELKEQFGDEYVDGVIAQMQEQLYQFEMDYAAKVEEVYESATEETAGSKKHFLKKWEIQHSPFYASKNADTGQPNRYLGKTVPSQGKKYLTSMPRKKIKGKDTGYFDKNYEAIQNNKTLKEFYDYYMETMRQLNLMLPHSKRNQLRTNSIVFTQKTVKEMMWSKEIGMDTGSVKVMQDILKESLRTSDYGTVAGNTIDPATGEQIREIQANFVNDGKKELKQMVQNKALVWQASNRGKEASEELKRQWRYEAMNELAMKKSYDLGHVLKNYALLAHAYKHKAAVEDKVHLAHELFNQVQEKITNAKDDQIVDQYGEAQSKEGLKQTKEALDYFMNNFDNFKVKEDQVAKQVDVQTSKEKEEIKKINEAIKALDELFNEKKMNRAKYEEIKSELIIQRDSVGGKLSYTKVGDKVLGLVQLKGMGWNVPAAFVNFVYGQLSNIVESASGRFYKNDGLWKATKRIYSSKKDRDKAILIAKKWDILSDGLDIITGTSRQNFLGRMPRAMQPYGLTTIAEELNQAPIVLAALKEKKIKDSNGKEVSLWDALDENGNLKDAFTKGEEGKKNVMDYEGNNDNPTHNLPLHELITSMKQVIKKVHGNYDINSPVKGKETLMGRAMLQFRSWLAESVAARFEREKMDYVTGTIRKGRYRTLWETKTEDGDLIVGLHAKIEMAQIITKKLIPFAKLGSPKNYKFSKTDIENMMEIARELQIMLGLLMLGALSLAAREGADDDSWTKWACTLTANNIARVSKDLGAFTSPAWPLEFLDKPVAAMGLWGDIKDISASAAKLLTTDGKIKSGINAGMNVGVKELIELAPLTNQVFKVNKMGKKLYANPYSVHGMMGTAISDWLEKGK